MKWQLQHKNRYSFKKNYDNCNVLLHRILKPYIFEKKKWFLCCSCHFKEFSVKWQLQHRFKKPFFNQSASSRISLKIAILTKFQILKALRHGQALTCRKFVAIFPPNFGHNESLYAVFNPNCKFSSFL